MFIASLDQSGRLTNRPTFPLIRCHAINEGLNGFNLYSAPISCHLFYIAHKSCVTGIRTVQITMQARPPKHIIELIKSQSKYPDSPLNLSWHKWMIEITVKQLRPALSEHLILCLLCQELSWLTPTYAQSQWLIATFNSVVDTFLQIFLPSSPFCPSAQIMNGMLSLCSYCPS